MASARFAWGIDIGNRALKAVRLVYAGNELRIDDFEVIEHESVLSNAGDNRPALIQTALANFVQRHQTRGGVVGIGVSGQSSFARFIKLPPVERKKIPEIVRFEAIQQIPFPLDEVEWSYQLFENPDSPDVEVGIFAMRKELVNEHIRYFTDAELNVQVVQMNPLAVYNAMYNDQRISGTTMIIDLGAENTDLVIAEGESVWMRSIPIGGNNFTEALVKSFKLNFAKAEDLKRNAKTSKYARQIFQAMRPVFADLVAEIQRSIGFYASVHRESRIKRIIGLGAAFRLPGLQKYLQQNLQLDVEMIHDYAAGAPADGKLAASFNENVLSLAAAYGLAIQAMGQSKITSSLLPLAIRRAKLWQDKTKWFAAAAAMFVLGTSVALGSLYFDDYSASQNSSERTKNDQALSQFKGLDNQWKQIESEGAADRSQIQEMLGLANYRDLWPQILRGIHDALPAAPAVGSDPRAEQPVRNERREIHVDTVKSEFVANMSTALADKSFGTDTGAAVSAQLSSSDDEDESAMTDRAARFASQYRGGGGSRARAAKPAASATSTNGPRGFILTMQCTTPYKDGAGLVKQQLLSRLLAMTKETMSPQRPFYVAKAVAVAPRRVGDDPGRMRWLEDNYQRAITIDLGSGRSGGTAGGSAGPARGTVSVGGTGGSRRSLQDLIAQNFTGRRRADDDDPSNNPFDRQHIAQAPGASAPGARVPGVATPARTNADGAAAKADANAPYRDRMTGESVLDDMILTVKVAVVVDPNMVRVRGEQVSSAVTP